MAGLTIQKKKGTSVPQKNECYDSGIYTGIAPRQIEGLEYNHPIPRDLKDEVLLAESSIWYLDYDFPLFPCVIYGRFFGCGRFGWRFLRNVFFAWLSAGMCGRESMG
jgi:hypothetical protein